MKNYKFFALNFGYQDPQTEQHIITMNHFVKVKSKQQAKKWAKDIIEENFKEFNKSELERKSLKVDYQHKYINSSGDFMTKHVHNKYNHRCIDLFFCEIWKIDEKYFNENPDRCDVVELV